MLAPVIGSPASISQNMIWRYSSSATVTCSCDIARILSPAMRIEAGTKVLVTGASRGIGRALAVAFAERGARVGLMARSEDELKSLAGEIGEDAVVLPADVGDRQAVEAATERFISETGGLDVVV